MNGQSIQTNVGSGTVSYAPTNFGSGESQSSVVSELQPLYIRRNGISEQVDE